MGMYLLTGVVSLVIALGLVQGNSEAQQEALYFRAVDTNSDGNLVISELVALFMKFDIDGDKQITHQEFLKDWVVIKQLGPVKQADKLFFAADTNDDGIITSIDLPDVFSYFDQNNDGFVDMNEFLTVWGDISLV